MKARRLLVAPAVWLVLSINVLGAGLYDRVKPGGPHGDGTDRVTAHLACAVVLGVARGASYATKAEARAAVNAHLVTVLSGQELTDFNQVLTNIEAKATLEAKMLYYLSFKEALILAESGDINETRWETWVELP